MDKERQQQHPSDLDVNNVEDVENINEVQSLKRPHGGLNDHVGLQQTPEEAKAERRFVWKIDLIILPIISVVYFLAQMVCAVP